MVSKVISWAISRLTQFPGFLQSTHKGHTLLNWSAQMKVVHIGALIVELRRSWQQAGGGGGAELWLLFWKVLEILWWGIVIQSWQ